MKCAARNLVTPRLSAAACAGKQLGRCAASRLLLEIGVGECLPVGVGATRCGWAYRHKRRSTDFGPWRLVAPAYLRDSLARAVIDIAVGAGRAASSADQGGGKRRLDI